MMANHKKYTTEEFIEAVKNSKSVRKVLLTLGLKETGGNYSFFYKQVESLKLNIAHFTGMAHGTRRNNSLNDIPLEEIFNNKTQKRLHPRRRKFILNNKFIGENCSSCGISKEWNNQPLTLEIDHINGDPYDHRIENLRLLCPNCHSQTPTFKSKNWKKWREENGIINQSKKESDRKSNFKNKCLNCGTLVYRDSIRCKKCNSELVSLNSNKK